MSPCPRHLRLSVCLTLVLTPAARGQGPPQAPAADPLPPGAVARLGTVHLVHGAGTVALSPDGNLLEFLAMLPERPQPVMKARRPSSRGPGGRRTHRT